MLKPSTSPTRPRRSVSSVPASLTRNSTDCLPRRFAILVEDLGGAGEVRQVASDAERSRAGGAGGARGGLVGDEREILLDLVGGSAERLLKLLAQDRREGRPHVVEGELLLTVPLDGPVARLGDLEVHRAEDLVAIVRRGHAGDDISTRDGRDGERGHGLTESGFGEVAVVAGCAGDEADE